MDSIILDFMGDFIGHIPQALRLAAETGYEHAPLRSTFGHHRHLRCPGIVYRRAFTFSTRTFT